MSLLHREILHKAQSAGKDDGTYMNDLVSVPAGCAFFVLVYVLLK